MASSRVGKSIKNASFSLIAQGLTVVLNFIARVKFVSVLGIAANGLNGLFVEVIAMLSLAELGVGAAITYSLYKPLAQNDQKKINQIMWLFKTAYLIIAAVILVAGLALTPFIHLIVKGTEFELSYIRIIFILFILRAVSTYLMSYKTSLLIADQKSYVVSAITAVSKILCTTFCVLSLFVFKSFEAYLLVIIVFNLFTNICVTIYSKKHYPYITGKEKLPKEECKEILSNIRHIFISKLSGKITNSTDNILISVLVSTIATGIYSNYSLIITNIKHLFDQGMGSVTGSFGNLMATESEKHCERTMKNLAFAFFATGLILGGGLMCASPAFIKMFFGEKYLLDNFTLYVCSCNLALSIWTLPLWHIMGVSGLFKDDKKISMTGSGLNLVVSYVLGKPLGMAGIFIGTICTYVVQMLLKLYLLYSRRLKLPYGGYILETVKMMLIAGVTIYLEYRLIGLLSFKSNMVSFLACGISSVVISALIILLFYGRSKEIKYFKDLIVKYLRKVGKKANGKDR